MPENNQDKLRNKFYVSIRTHPVGAYRGELSRLVGEGRTDGEPDRRGFDHA